jgi:undecaprenyl-diphosphatase
MLAFLSLFSDMEYWQAIVLGIVEGITEYLPISSTGHLIVTERLLGIGMNTDKVAADTFAVCIQGGAILAVLGLYFPRVMRMIRGVLGKDPEGLKLAIAVVVGFFPAAIIGLLLNDWIEEKLFSVWPIVAAWFVGGIAIIAVAQWKKKNPTKDGGKDLLTITWKMALIIGLLQCIAMWPGTSRSLMTIVGGVLVGLSLKSAVEYSFLLGVVTLSAATAKKALWKVESLDPIYDQWFGGTHLMWDTFGAIPIIVGMLAAALSAAIAVKWLVSYLNRNGLEIFGWYRIIIAIGVGLMLYQEIIKDSAKPSTQKNKTIGMINP